jgi:hypothetical protein
MALVSLCRAFGPLSISHWFRPLPIESPTDLGLLLAAVLSAMLIHEMGHLMASLMLGFKVLGGAVGPLRIQGLHGRWKLSFSNRPFFAASISAVPASLNHWRAAMLIVIAAGPLATVGALLTAAGMAVGNQSYAFFRGEFVEVSALLFILGLLPNGRQSRTPNDARLLLNLALRNKGAEELELSVMLSQQVIQGVRPEDYPPALITRLAAWRGRPESQFAFAQALVRWALDSDESALAEAWDLHALALAADCNSRLKNLALASSACLDVIYREDLEAARIKFENVDFGGLFPACLEQRARAAHQIALGRGHGANPHIIRAQYALPRGITAYDLERKLIARLHMKALYSASAGDAKTVSAHA